MLTFPKQFFDTFEAKITDELEIIEWINNVIDPIIADPNEMFSYYRQCLKKCENPKYFDVFDSCYVVLRSIVVHLIDGIYDKDLPEKLLAKHSLEIYSKHPDFTRRLEWLKKKFDAE